MQDIERKDTSPFLPEDEKKANGKRLRDTIVRWIFFCIALVCASIIIFIAVFIVYKGLMPFIQDYDLGGGEVGKDSLYNFLFGTHWNQGGANFSAGYLAANTLFVTFLSLILSVPISIMTALLIGRVAPKPLADLFETGIQLLASIPSVIYGLFGMGIVNPIIRDFASALGLQTSGGNSLLSGVIVLAMMSIPTMTMMSVTAIKSVDQNLIKASLAVGASKTQTNFKIVIKAAQSGIFAGIILGIGRAVGEATATQMVIGNAMSGPTFNPFDISATLTTQMLMGIGEAVSGSIGYDIRFSAGILLMIILFAIDIVLNKIKDTIHDNMTGQVHVSTFKKIIATLRPFAMRIRSLGGKESD